MTAHDQLIRLILIAISMLMSIAIIGLISSIKLYRDEIKSLKQKMKKLEISSLDFKTKGNEKKSVKR